MNYPEKLYVSIFFKALYFLKKIKLKFNLTTRLEALKRKVPSIFSLIKFRKKKLRKRATLEMAAVLVVLEIETVTVSSCKHFNTFYLFTFCN